MNLSELSIDQLKALKCDHYENIAKSQQSLILINQEMERRRLDGDDGKDIHRELRREAQSS